MSTPPLPPIPCPFRGHRVLQKLSISDVEPLRWDRAPVPSRVRDPRLVAPTSLRIPSGLPNRQTVTGRPAAFGSRGSRPGDTPGWLRSPVKGETHSGCTAPHLHRTQPGGSGQRSQPPSPLPAPSRWVVWASPHSLGILISHSGGERGCTLLSMTCLVCFALCQVPGEPRAARRRDVGPIFTERLVPLVLGPWGGAGGGGMSEYGGWGLAPSWGVPGEGLSGRGQKSISSGDGHSLSPYGRPRNEILLGDEKE